MIEQALSLHFLRPQWLWALALLPLLWLFWRVRHRQRNIWRQHVDAHLLPSLMVEGRSAYWWPLLGMTLAWLLAVLAMAGPAWRQQAQPLWQNHAPLVIAVDMSSRMNATDLPPSRLLQVRAKLARLLSQRKDGEVALLAYADDAFTVAPLTDDGGNVALFLDALSPDVMPVDGQRPQRAIEQAITLLQQADFSKGQILLLTDHAGPAAIASAAAAAGQGWQVSVLGVGTASGSAYRQRDGSIAQARLDATSLQRLAAAGGGQYARLGNDDADLQSLGVLNAAAAGSGQGQSQQRIWLDQGYWLLLPLLLLVALAFRRGALAAWLLVAVMLPMAAPSPALAQAAATSAGAGKPGGDWWQRADQKQYQRIEQGVQAYRNGDFKQAEQAFAGIESSEALYNYGNALAKQGQYDAAIKAYDRALQLKPGEADTLANRAAVEAARKRQPPSGQKPSDKQGQGSQQSGAAGDNASAGDRHQDQASKSDARPGDNQPSPPPASRSTSPSSASADNNKAAPAGNPAKSSADTAAPPPGAEDSAAQQAADAAQKQRMQQALEQANKDGQGEQQKAAVAGETTEQREQRQAVDAWLRRVPDDPGGLLKTKFRLEYERRQREGR
ncbi:VWA domain-containing protein [Pseudoxanthomonas dokdonensis]|uniref:VWFA domain-containing protein n=1 Tax=Pseudoxanthomonas dokdonensis TaxID=344882 RepID=A0A0R0CJF6_9GAMM|nr:VWA domain-containing protein [Pseudoxanthomonas dokdonensis]KRG70057.1 hypothetical protein ABB29_07430 [Pseudoxanthomonas dokdonensis]